MQIVRSCSGQEKSSGYCGVLKWSGEVLWGLGGSAVDRRGLLGI